jgi:hypothetical protein
MRAVGQNPVARQVEHGRARAPPARSPGNLTENKIDGGHTAGETMPHAMPQEISQLTSPS